MADPNWLMSTIAQTTAAIVAIVGGFIVSRLISMSIEKESLLSRLKDINTEYEFKNNLLVDLNKRILDKDCSDFINDSINDIIENVGDISLENLLRKHNCNLSETDLKPYYDNAVKDVREAFDFYTKISDGDYDDSDFDEIIEKENLIIEGKKKEIFRMVFDFIEEAMGNKTYSNLPNITPLSEQQIYSQTIQKKEYLYIECDWLKKQKSLIEYKLALFSRPLSMFWGVAVFIYFIIVGIIYPVSFLPVDSEQFNYCQRNLVINLFYSGLLGVSLYLVISILKLTRNNRSKL